MPESVASPHPRPPADRPWRLVLAGLGNVGSGVLRILDERAAELRRRHGLEFVLVGVAEHGGAAVDPAGLDLATIRRTVREGRPVAELPGVGRPGLTPAELVTELRPDVLLEATPVNLDDGEPGLGTVRTALALGTHAVLANKGPLALAYEELTGAADLRDGWGLAHRHPGPRLRFSACVAGALPVVNIGARDLAGAGITRIEALFNGTTQSILRAMEAGQGYAEALADAQRRGIAEADPSLDVDGLDAACKLVITVNAVLDQQAKLGDVRVEGIRGVTREAVTAAAERGERIVLLCLAEATDGGFRLSVRPTAVPLTHPLAGLTPDEMGVVYHSDEVDRIVASSLEPGAEPASAAMVRDLLDIAAASIAATGPLAAREPART
ncbi:homoserine dehydrogenase [Micromonospora sp. WMMA1923]|uniref:homoserine dehydrogenase n=1 Tax=Micromonospora sp. WMMA1923 TaxID=3404125 RepID=UPI003B966D11